MSATLIKDPGGNYRVVLSQEPTYCHGLQAAPARIESALKEGLWLIVLIAVWSSPDLEAMQVALSVVKAMNGRVQLGLRPFDAHQEVLHWCPNVKERYASPIWLLLRDGALLDEMAGLRNEERILQWIESRIT
jgi:hypothetical protein